MCARVHCLLGINADFAGVGTDQPLGAFVTDGELLRSPSSTHHQLSFTGDGRLTDQTFGWTGRLMTTDLKQLSFDGVNVDRAPGKIVLYTPAFGPTDPDALSGRRSRRAGRRTGRRVPARADGSASRSSA